MTDRPDLAVVPLAAHVEAERREERAEIVKVAEEALEKAKRGELLGLVLAYEYAPDAKQGGAVGFMVGVAPGASAATLVGELEVAKASIIERYVKNEFI